MWDVWFHGQIVCFNIEHLSNINEIVYCKVASSNTSHLEAHAGLFRFLMKLNFGWSEKLKDSFWNHVTINLTTRIRQIWPKCSIKWVQIRLYYCVIVLPRIHWKPSLKLMRKQKQVFIKVYLYSFYRAFGSNLSASWCKNTQ